MGKDDTPVKKRRKVASTSPANCEPAKPVLPVDIYKRAIEYEEKEASLRSADKDAETFHTTCNEIRKLFSDISELKNKNDENTKEEISSKRIKASLYISSLKKLNRLDKMRLKNGRETLHKEKQRVDSTHLLLQNLLYEADYLNKEVAKCLQFKSKDEEIELVTLDQFYKEAPEDVTRKDVTKKDEHQLKLARLEWELRQRRELSNACSELVMSKERVAAAIAATRSRLDALAPHLKDVLKATKPLQECLALKLDEKRDEKRIANLLPEPLFLLYANSRAYAEAFSQQLLSVAINGDEQEAEQLNVAGSANQSDSDSELESEEQNKKKRRHRATKISKEEKAETKRKEVLKKYPLSVQLTISIKNKIKVNLMFAYLVKLRIVTVKCSVDFAKAITGVSAADVLSSTNLLHAVYPDDKGTESPHPATDFILKAAGINSAFSKFVPELGRPYLWVQEMCGLDFIQAKASKQQKVMTQNPALSVSSIENVVLKFKSKLKSRLALMKELQDLESGKIKFDGDAVRISGSLTVWQSVSWPEYNQSVSTTTVINDGLVSSNDLFYRAIITRQSAKLIALVAVKSDYPKQSPIFSLSLHWNGTHHAGSDDDIRDIERIINTNWGKIDDKQVTLTSQMIRLLSCLDILMESVCSSEFPPDKVMLHPVRGRTRVKPYKFLKQGLGMYVQY